MFADKDSQEQPNQILKKKLNKKDQRTRKVQNMKKKYHHHTRTISDEVARQFSQSEMMQLMEDKQLSMPSSSLSRKKKCFSLYTESNLDPSLFLTDYSMVSNNTFKDMLLTTMTTDDNQNFVNKLFDTDEMLTCIRQLTQLINKLNYFKLQDEQWSYYYNLGVSEGIWNGRVSNSMALINSMCYSYGRSKILIAQRQKNFTKKLQMLQINIDEHIKQISLSTADMNNLMTIINDFLYTDQYELRMELERRRAMLKFDARDHQLVHTFYNLKPRQTEIHSAKTIWKAVQDEQALKYEIALFKTWLSSSKSSSSLTLCTFQDLALTKINDIFTHLIFDKQLSSATNHQTNSIDQFIEDIIMKTISTAETIVENYVQKVNNEKQKVLNNQEKFKKPPTVDSVITAIENRQLNMIQRAQYNVEQILKTIFQENNITKT
ncbi:unnamed protein product [Adineta steineri]|uniref:Uncharacterized protein n=1 Tax=Adineta steineri TaxID=433720 RepID=A0A819I070_9BILA|nr:unnamed protein product [Adineta steineri]CAF3908593.1 unnamed protein product [Adineta steineri]